MKRSSKPPRASSEQDQPQHDPDPLFYREVAMADLPSESAEEVETFRHILDLPGKLCQGFPLLFWAWMTKKANRSLDQEALHLCSLLALTSKMPLISLSRTSWLLIYLRVNTSNPPPPPPLQRVGHRFFKNLYLSQTLRGPYQFLGTGTSS